MEGYNLYKSEGLTTPPKAEELLNEYRKSCDAVGFYIESRLAPCDDKERKRTLEFHVDFLKWCKNEDVTACSLREYVLALRRKNLLGRDRVIGHYVKGFKIKAD